MTHRRLATPPAPKLTGGDERPTAACTGRLDLIDAVYARGYEGNHARRRLLTLCGTCPVREDCWADKQWRDALRAEWRSA